MRETLKPSKGHKENDKGLSLLQKKINEKQKQIKNWCRIFK